MPEPRTRANVPAAILFRLIGAILLIVSAIHFAVTPSLLHGIIDGHVDEAAARIVRASFLLNHLVVGVLLIPIGLSTMFAAHGIARADRLARRIGWANTLAVSSLPVVIAAVMGRREILDGGPFTVAVGLVALAALALAVGMWRTRPARPGPSP